MPTGSQRHAELQDAVGYHRGRGFDGASSLRKSPRTRRRCELSQHGIGAPLDWSAAATAPDRRDQLGTGLTSKSGVDSEEGSVDFSKDLEAGSLKSLDFGARYADHERENRSPEGASP